MSDCDLLTKGDLIKSRWRITHKIGGGGFGQIYQAYDKFRRELVAVKVESNSQARQGIRMEVTVLRRIQNREHVCELLSGGTSTLYNYMIMTLLGSNLSELRRSLSEQCFTLSTTLRISLQILEAIQSVHSIGFLHRDIKPSNFAIGRKKFRQIFILDFGLARKYTDYDQHVRPARIEAGFRGTIRYASVNAHNNRELGRHDDLWSFFYMLIEFLIGSLPWSKIKDKDSVGHMKETYDYTRFLTYLPDEFDKFLEHINELHYEDKPNYEFLRSIFISSIQRLGYQDNDPYDWEKSVEQDQLTKVESQKISSQENERKTIPENSRLPTSNHLLKKQADSNHQQSPYGFDRIKLDSIGTGDQQQINHKKLSSQPEKSRRTNNGLLTYISQQFSNAVAPGTPSLISQWSPHNGETFTDDEILKGNKSNSQTSLRLTQPKPNEEYYLSLKSPQNIPIPFGTYIKNSRRSSSSFRKKI